MEKNNIILLGIIPLILFVVIFSGCTTSTDEKMIFEYTFNHTGANYADFDVLNVTLPNGTTKVRVEYQNLSSGPYINSISGESYSDLEVMLLNTVLPEGQLNNLEGVVMDVKRVQVKNNTLTGNLNFTKTGGKSLRIRGGNIIGKIKVYVS